MKKRATAVAFLLASLVTSIQANAENGWYMGTKMGWSHLNLLKSEETDKTTKNNITKDKLSAPIAGLFLGYNFNPNISVEMSNDTIGLHPYSMFKSDKDANQFNDVQLSTKLSYPVTHNVNLYTQMGGVLFWDDIPSPENVKNFFSSETPIIPSVSIGAEYVINKKLTTRLDYTWKNSFKNIINSPIKAKSGDISFSLGWKVGSSHSSDTESLYPVKKSEKPYISLNDSVNFPFNGTEIEKTSCKKLKQLTDKIQHLKTKNISMLLSGHTDTIENKNHQILSEKRAHNIKNYFVSHGIPKNSISAQGLGHVYPVTNQTCKNIHNHDLLVNCLSPDRRVDIEVIAG